MKIIHKRKTCIGCGVCAAVCPEFFEMSEVDNLATLKNGRANGENFELEVTENENAKQAAEGCPVQAIEIRS